MVGSFVGGGAINFLRQVNLIRHPHHSLSPNKKGEEEVEAPELPPLDAALGIGSVVVQGVRGRVTDPIVERSRIQER